MTFGQFLTIVRARWAVVLTVLALTLATTIVVSLLLPKRYAAIASVMVDFKPDPVSAMMFGSMTPPAVMATQVDILRSDRVAFRVARDLRLEQDARLRQQFLADAGGRGSFEQWLTTEVLAKSLDVQPSRESSVIRVSYQAADPQVAAALANAFVDAYVRTSVELRTDPARQYNTFFDIRAKEARERLEAAQTRLSAYQKDHGIIAGDERMDVETQRLNELNSQLVALQAIAAESVSRAAQAQGEQGDRLQEVISNPLIGQLKAEVSRTEARLKELDTRYGEAHPQVRETRANLSELRDRLEVETRKVTGSVRVTNTINQAREAELRAQLQRQRARVQTMKELRDEGMLLVRDVESAQREYHAIQQRATQTSLESQAQLTNVHVLSQAVPPFEPSAPRLLTNALLAVLVGALLGVCMALLLEIMDRRVRGAEDLVAALDLPVVGVMLAPAGRGLLGRKKASVMQQRLLAALPPAAAGHR
jgi:polysaccharide biosynthesis transport protein